MKTKTATAVTLAVLPASPTEIPLNASIETLETVKAAWLRQAVEDGLAWSLWRVVSVFGQKKRIYTRNFLDFEWETATGRARIRFSESVTGFVPAAGCFYARTDVHVTVGDQTVADIVWEHPSGEEPSAEHVVEEKSHFVPGRWTEKLPRLVGQAIEVVERKAAEETENARQQLLQLLLAGEVV